jgi:Na+/H+-dicarboxylate symporter
MELWKKVGLGIILGILFGALFPPEYSKIIKPIGDIFLSLIRMVILPLIFFAIVSGMTNVSDPSTLGRIGLKATLAFVTTTLFAVVFGIGVALVLQPGAGAALDFGNSGYKVTTAEFDIIAYLVKIVPTNALGAFVDNNILQVVFFSIFTGITMNKMSSSAAELKVFVQASAKLFIKMISFIIELSPYAAFALIAYVVSQHGIDSLISLSKLVGAVFIAMVLQYLIFGLMIIVFCRVSPLEFYKKSLEYQLIALSSSSSKAALATTMNVCRNKLGVSESSTSFVLPLGAAINMDGFAINLSLTAIFFAQALGVDLSMGDYCTIILTSTVGSIGGAGIPGASLIMLPLVLTSVGLPIEGVALLAGIDRILDMLRTAVNITGDATITMIIDHSEGTFDKKQYYSDKTLPSTKRKRS